MTRRVKAHIRLGIRSVSLAVRMKKPQILTYPLVNFAAYFSVKIHGVSPQTFVEFLHEIQRKPSAFLFFSAKKIFISCKGCFAAERE